MKTLSLKAYPRVYLELLCVGFAVTLGGGLTQAFLPILARDLDPSGILVGFVVSAWFLSRLFTELPAGLISDRIGRGKVIITGVGLTALGALFCAVANDIYLLILGRAFWGLGQALFLANSLALVIDLYDPKLRGRTIGVFQSVVFIGNTAGAPFGAFMVEAMGYAAVFYFSFALILVFFAISLTSSSLRATRRKQTHAPRASLAIGRTLASLRSWGMIRVCLSAFFYFCISQGIFNTVLPLYLKNDLLFPLVDIGLILSLRMAGFVMTTIAAGFLCDKFGVKPTLLAGLFIKIVALTVFTVIFKVELFMVATFLMGVGMGLVSPSLMVLLSDIANPSLMGGNVGIYRTFLDLGGFIGPILFMLVYSTYSSNAIFFVAISFTVINIILLAFWKIVPWIQNV